MHLMRKEICLKFQKLYNKEEGKRLIMANSKMIIVNGAQGSGKTTVTDYLRFKMNYTNLYRLCGTSDSSPAGKIKATEMYNNLLDYIEKLQNMSINLLFDQIYFTEEVYDRLGFKEYTFTDVYEKLNERLAKFDFDIYVITLYLSDTSEFEARLLREGKHNMKYAKYNADSSIKQQNVYLEIADELRKYNNINVINIDNCQTEEEVKHQLNEVLGI